MREPDTPVPDRGEEAGPRRIDEEPDNARRITFTIAVLVTSVFLLTTAAGLGRLLLGGDDAKPSAADPSPTGEEAPEAPGATEGLGGEGTVSDPRSGLAYTLAGEGWTRLGDDQVPPEYTSYTVYGSPEDPGAVIVTGGEELGPLEPLAATAVSMATRMVGHLATDGGDLWVEPSGATEVDGRPAFGATMGDDSGSDEEAYGRFLVVELDGDQGAFVLGLNTDGGAEATADIDAAFDSLTTL
ncbi:hypothetical protein [Nocardiopsis alba]|uniref:hypothetical protein n=1 Tax=Nocardiopsis alba TaxID=53437 RepID=UPI003D7652A4